MSNNYVNDKTFQVKCDRCGLVREIKTHGHLLESDRVCIKCSQLISEQNTQEIGGELLLE
jgi:hypothetical protein